jgi:hypothetical protein
MVALISNVALLLLVSAVPNLAFAEQWAVAHQPTTKIKKDCSQWKQVRDAAIKDAIAACEKDAPKGEKCRPLKHSLFDFNPTIYDGRYLKALEGKNGTHTSVDPDAAYLAFDTKTEDWFNRCKGIKEQLAAMKAEALATSQTNAQSNRARAKTSKSSE